jgi:hypothetical protein
MTGNPCWQAIPTKLSEAQSEESVLPHLSRGRRGAPPTHGLQTRRCRRKRLVVLNQRLRHFTRRNSYQSPGSDELRSLA